MRPSENQKSTMITDVDPAADYFWWYDASAGLLKGLLASLITRSVSPVYNAFTGTANTLTQAAHNYTVATNTGATALASVTLWTAGVGDRLRVVRDADYEFRIIPATGQGFADASVIDKYLSLQSAGGVDLRYYATGWHVENDSALYVFET